MSALSASPRSRPPVRSSVAAAQHAHRKRRWILVALGILVLFTPVTIVGVGSAAIPLDVVFGVILSHIPGLDITITWAPNVDAIIWDTRLPRILLAICVGAILGVAGVVLQALVRNALAEPYVLGVSSGASAGASLAIVRLGAVATWSVGLSAFVGAVAATILLLLIAGRSHTSLHLILAGLAVNFGFYALTNLMIVSSGSPETSQAVVFWMLGSLARARWGAVAMLSVVAILCTVGLAFAGPVLDALASGDRTALAVGLNPRIARLGILVVVSGVVGLAVSASGAIGFVGLIVPHLTRTFMGHSHRYLVLGAALTGSVVLVAADTVSRIAFAPAEIPIGVITGLLGAPFIALMVRRMQKSLRAAS